jgi:hypothetical protein
MSDVPVRIYARIADGAVAELFETAGDMSQMFNPELVWIDVTAGPAVTVGWLHDGQAFSAPPPPPPAALTIAELQAQLQSLAAQIAAFAGKN